MAKKRKAATTVKRERAPSSTWRGRMELTLERIDRNLLTVVEALPMFATKTELQSWVDTIEMRLAVIEAVVRKNSEDIRKNTRDIELLKSDIELLKSAVLELSDELRGLREDLGKSTKPGATIRDELADLDRRVTAIEDQLDRE